ncbi:MAG: hypothetical protein SH868_01630 [Bythopirellula sp.]|nr:hypothetical protein [Bythopirellula sp.]
MVDFRLDKTVIQESTLEAQGDDRAFWFSKTPDERMIALEHLRQVVYGYDPATERLQRILTVVERP